MTERETTLVSVMRAIRMIFRYKWRFLAVCALVFFVSLWVLSRLDLLPERSDKNRLSTVTIAQAQAIFPSVDEEMEETVVEQPQRVVIDSVGVDVVVNNPIRTDIATLDNSLLSGVVRYPTSGVLGENGNVVIFGHSSYLPVVRNNFFRAFNGIEDLKRGEIIEVYGENVVYRYEVSRVYEADADDTRIPLTNDTKKLTLSTCNSFGDLDDRYVVEAYFVGSTQAS